MKDLEKMKRDFQRKLQMAELENKLEARFGLVFMVIEKTRGDGVRILARGVGKYGISNETISLHDAAVLLDAFPSDDVLPLDASARNPKGGIFGSYHIRAERSFNDAFTSLRIEWKHGGNVFELSLKIDGEDLLEQFFINSHRKMTSSEQATYKPTRRGRIVRDLDIAIKSFMCEHVTYSGGYLSATDLDEITRIIETIKTQK